MKTKRFMLLLVLTLSSFFFFLDNVKADTYNFPIQQEQLDFVSISLPTCVNTVENFIDNNPQYNFTGDYIIAYIWSDYYIFFKTSSSSLSKVWFLPNSTSNKFFAINYYGGTFNARANFNSTFTELTSVTVQSLGNLSQFYNVSIFYYSNFDIYFGDSSQNVFNFTFSDKSYQVIEDTSNSLPTIHNLYSMWYGDPISPTPPDDTPLLTDFVSVVIDRFTFITSSLHSNYILLSCFTIFTLFFIILLFRRLQ